MVKFTLKQCHYFAAVAKFGGMAQAAREINISQPAIAQAMDKLEAICKFNLFIRHHAKGFELTPKGRAVLTEVRKIINEANNTEIAIEAIRTNSMGTIRLGCFQSIAPFYLASIIKKYNNKYPKIKIEVTELLQDQLISALLNNELDLAIVYDLGLEQHTLKLQSLSQARPYVILPEGHKFSDAKTISLYDFKDEKYVLFDATGSREYFYKIFSKMGIQPDISFRSTSLESVRSAVGNGLGYSILSMKPPSQISYDGKKIIALNIKEEISPTPIVMASNTTSNLGSMQKDFISYCKTQIIGQ